MNEKVLVWIIAIIKTVAEAQEAWMSWARRIYGNSWRHLPLPKQEEMAMSILDRANTRTAAEKFRNSESWRKEWEQAVPFPADGEEKSTTTTTPPPTKPRVPKPETGRMSSSDPNLQNLKKEDEAMLQRMAPKAPPTKALPNTGNPMVDVFIQELDKAGWRPGLDAAEVKTIVADALAGKEKTVNVVFKTENHEYETGGERFPSWWEDALVNANARIPQMWIGPAGCGKGYNARRLANVLGLPFYAASLTAGVDEGILTGWLLPVDREKAGVFSFVSSFFVKAYTTGGVMLLDEVDRADNNMMMILNDAVANGEFFIPINTENPVLKMHKDFVLVAAANTHGHGGNRQYCGAGQLDESTLSRFRAGQIEMDYDEETEMGLAAPGIWKFGQRLRARCRAHHPSWTKDVSTRDIIQVGARHRVSINGKPMPVERAWFTWFSDWTDADLAKVDVVRDNVNRTVVLR